ncbi:hypothetical protein WAE31_15625 (plasmid) [Xanthomonas axonopodis pv. vasculorum]
MPDTVAHHDGKAREGNSAETTINGVAQRSRQATGHAGGERFSAVVTTSVVDKATPSKRCGASSAIVRRPGAVAH